jgi:hypothetical protein
VEARGLEPLQNCVQNSRISYSLRPHGAHNETRTRCLYRDKVVPIPFGFMCMAATQGFEPR